MPFSKLGLCQDLLEAIKKSGYKEPTAIQQKVIPLVLEHHDIMAKAQTGSGKSASFILPLLELVSRAKYEGKSKIRIVVLTPTRELTQQLVQSFETLSACMSKKPKVVGVIGGESIGDQLFALQKGCDILVATSGRFLDVLSKKQIDLSYVEHFVLDEADKMLDLGFAQELSLIFEALPKKRQNLLFSATYPAKMLSIAAQIMQDPKEISVANQEPTVENVTQRALLVNKENRAPLLRHLLKSEKYELVLVFMASKRAADNIAAKFQKHGFAAESFHGDLFQEDRNYTLQEFKTKNIQILFATDLVSRGLDIDDITCVINFDLPRSAANYIHRIGRTARAGKGGMAISFIDHLDQAHFSLIEKRSGIKLQREQIEGFELTGEAPKQEKGKAPIKGKGKSKKDKAREKAAL